MATGRRETLRSVLKDCVQQGGYALGLSPGFFRFYAEMGACRALEEAQLLDAVTHVSGASAGALVGGFLAAGMAPSQLHDILMGFRREDFWDMGGIGGLLKGGMFQAQLEKHLPVSNFEDCKRQFGVTAFDLVRMRTSKVTSGELATAIRASCTFPLMFQPVWMEGSYHIDGGVFDDSGLMALPGVPASNTILNIVCDRSRLRSSAIPEHLPNRESIRLVTVVLENIPMVNPFSLDQGPTAFQAAHNAICAAFDRELEPGRHDNHWVVVADAAVSSGIPPSPTNAQPVGEVDTERSPSKKQRTEDTARTIESKESEAVQPLTEERSTQRPRKRRSA